MKQQLANINNNANGDIGVGCVPTAKFSVAELAAINAEGGIMIKLTNRTGVNTVKGTIVAADLTNDLGFYTAPADADMPIGIVYETGIANAAEAWIVIQGIAEVLIKDGVTPVRGYVAFCSSVAGRADVSSSAPAATTHFREIGHTIQSKASGTAVLCKMVLHFN